MAKDTYWFPHDYEPTSDPKMQAMLSVYGGWGYGIFWRVSEMLHSDALHKLPFKKYIYSAIAKQMQPNAQQNKILLASVEITPDIVQMFIVDCINEFELFNSDDTHFWSSRVHRNIGKKKSISEERSIAGKNGYKAKQKKAIAEQTQAITPHKITGDKKREDYILNNTHRHYTEKIELKEAAAATISSISSSVVDFSFINHKRVDYLSQKISEKYFDIQPIKNIKALVLDWMERDKLSFPEEYKNHKEYSPL